MTGRTHQIRVHLSSINHPILNDLLYYQGKFNVSAFHQRYAIAINEILKKINRVALHSSSLTFLHPSNKKKITIEAPLPIDFKNAVEIINDFDE